MAGRKARSIASTDPASRVLEPLLGGRLTSRSELAHSPTIVGSAIQAPTAVSVSGTAPCSWRSAITPKAAKTSSQSALSLNKAGPASAHTISELTLPSDVPVSIGRTVYRIVQEALTNVHKHVRDAATEMLVHGAAGEGVTVRVTNIRPVAAGSLLPGAGAGLAGLRERVDLSEGTLTVGLTPDGGWRVEAGRAGGDPGAAGAP